MTIITGHSRVAAERRSFRSRRGFTLTELLVAIFVSGIVLAMAMSSFNLLAKGSAGIGNYSSMNMQSRVALDIFASDIRMANDVAIATDTALRFTAYNSSGGHVWVQYTFSADEGILYRTYAGVTEMVLTDIDSFEFVYYDLQRDSTSDALSVKEVEINAVMSKNVVVLQNTNQVISSRFMMRNRQVSS